MTEQAIARNGRKRGGRVKAAHRFLIFAACRGENTVGACPVQIWGILRMLPVFFCTNNHLLPGCAALSFLFLVFRDSGIVFIPSCFAITALTFRRAWKVFPASASSAHPCTAGRHSFVYLRCSLSFHMSLRSRPPYNRSGFRYISIPKVYP